MHNDEVNVRIFFKNTHTRTHARAQIHTREKAFISYCGRPWPAASINISRNIHQNQVLIEPLYSA